MSWLPRERSTTGETVIYWLRAIVLSIVTGELTRYLLDKYFPGTINSHLSSVVTAFVMTYIMVPRESHIRAENNKAFSMHRVDRQTLVIDIDEVNAANVKTGDMVALRSRYDGAIHHLTCETPFFIAISESKGNMVKVTPWKSTELVI